MPDYTSDIRSFPVPHAVAWAHSVCLNGVDDFYAYAWEPESIMAVVGLGQEAKRELYLERLQAENVRFMRRASGGGAVLLGPGILCFGVIAPPRALGGQYDIHAAFARLCAPVLSALRRLGVRGRLAGISDIAVEMDSESRTESGLRKIAGCAQLRRKHAVLVHGSLLVNADIAGFSRYLRFPSKVPDYRDSRSHEEFCCNLQTLLQHPVSTMELGGMLRNEVDGLGWSWHNVPAELPPAAAALMRDRYMNQDWNLYRKR